MTKKLIAVAIVAILLIGGGVYYLTNKNTNSTGTNQQTTIQTQGKLEGNGLVQAVLDKVKSQTPTVGRIYVVTESTDGNNLIGKSGQYQYAGSFYDTRTGYKPTDDNGNDIDISKGNFGATAGGTIEVFANETDATKRGEYLQQFQTGAIQSGAYRVVGKVVLRVSEDYKASQQKEMLDLMQGVL